MGRGDGRGVWLELGRGLGRGLGKRGLGTGVRAPAVLAMLALEGRDEVLEVMVRVLPAVDGGVFIGFFGANLRM